MTDSAGENDDLEADPFIAINEQDDEISISVDPENEIPDDFIDINKEKKGKEETEKETFSIQGADETGRDMAFATFKKIQGSILDSWEVLSNDEDKELFYDYLLTNMKLYFDKFEDELQLKVAEPTTPEYEKAVAASGQEM